MQIKLASGEETAQYSRAFNDALFAVIAEHCPLNVQAAGDRAVLEISAFALGVALGGAINSVRQSEGQATADALIARFKNGYDLLANYTPSDDAQQKLDLITKTDGNA